MKQGWELLCEQTYKDTRHHKIFLIKSEFLHDENVSMFWPTIHTVLPFQLFSSHDSAAL
jgi:hypothetical protein